MVHPFPPPLTHHSNLQRGPLTVRSCLISSLSFSSSLLSRLLSASSLSIVPLVLSRMDSISCWKDFSTSFTRSSYLRSLSLYQQSHDSHMTSSQHHLGASHQPRMSRSGLLPPFLTAHSTGPLTLGAGLFACPFHRGQCPLGWPSCPCLQSFWRR